MIIGFSSGCLYKTHNPLSPETIELFRGVGCNAIEIMFHGVEDTNDFAKLTEKDFRGFKFLSIHAPIYRGTHQLEGYKKALSIIEEKHKEIGFDSVILHPDMFDNFSFLNDYDLPYAVENMDNRKNSCKNVADLKEVFTKFNSSFVLDINHVFTNDPKMELTNDLLSNFGKKLSEIHLSGFDTFHDPLYKTKQDHFVDDIRDFNVPIIIESGIDDISEAKLELEYIKTLLLKEK